MLMFSSHLSALLDDAALNGKLSSHRVAALLSAEPGKASAIHLSGLWALRQGDARRAVVLLRQAMNADGDNVAFQNNCGVALRMAHQPTVALTYFRKAIQLAPQACEPRLNVSDVLLSIGDHDAATDNLYQALASNPGCAEIYRRIAEIRMTQGIIAEAESLLDKAAALGADTAALHISMGQLAMAQRQWQAAGVCFEAVLQREPNDLDALCSLAELGEDWRVDDLARQLLDARHRVTDLESQFRLEYALSNIARLRRDFEAEARHLQRALYFKPDDVKTRVSYAKWLLQSGNYSAGWVEFEWRWKQPHRLLPLRALASPRWLGEPLNGEAILLHAEQGDGDIIQFVRYVPMVAARGGRVILEVPEPLKRLMTSLRGVTKIIAVGEPVPPIAWQCPLMSLPLAFSSTVDTIPACTPYLSAMSSDVLAWSDRFPSFGLRVGIVWAGSHLHANDRRRSMPPAALAPLREIDRVSFVSLQCHCDSSEPTASLPFPHIDVSRDLTDYAVTAAIIENLDLVISVCSSVTHLAGAVGKEVWILLPFASEYRWLRDREDTPWYSRARLFRQPAPGNWNAVVKQVEAALRLRVSRETIEVTIKY